MRSYAILESKDSLKKLCFRAGYRLENVNFNSILSGKEIIEKLKIELDLDEQDLHLDISLYKKYRLYHLKVSKASKIKSKIGCFFRDSIGGILLVYLG